MKTETAVNLGIFAIVALGIWWIIKKGQDWIGDNPLGAVGGDDPFAEPGTPDYPGWLTWFYIHQTNPYLFLVHQGEAWEESFTEGGVTYEDAWGSGITW